MNTEMNIKFNDDKSITINDVRYIPDFWGEAKASAEPEKKHTGIEEPERGDSIYYVDGDGILETYDYSSGEFEHEYLRGRVTTDEQLCSDRDRAAQIRFALEKYAAEHNAEVLNSHKYCIVYNPNWEKLSVDLWIKTKTPRAKTPPRRFDKPRCVNYTTYQSENQGVNV